MQRNLTITIDGPSGSGKSTAARALAKRLGYLYLDTGAMYRAIALQALRKGVGLDDRRALTRLAGRSRVSFRVDPGHRVRVLLEGRDVSEMIRRPDVSEAASRIATIPGVRRALVRQQRLIGVWGRVVAEGRDTGTVVFPRADLKFFLSASAAERASRRWNDLRRAGHAEPRSRVLQDLGRRDRRDRLRAASPLRLAKGAIRIDNTDLQYSQVVDKILDYVRRIHNSTGCGRVRRAV